MPKKHAADERRRPPARDEFTKDVPGRLPFGLARSGGSNGAITAHMIDVTI